MKCPQSKCFIEEPYVTIMSAIFRDPTYSAGTP
jgi:hypothetical protein